MYGLMPSADLTVRKISHKRKHLLQKRCALTGMVMTKEGMSFDSRPLFYAQLEKAQNADQNVMKILKMDNAKYKFHDFHGGEQSF